jgi:uncharacterized protein
MSVFEDDKALAVGKVFEVAGAKLKITLDSSVTELIRSYKGRIYPIGQIGSILKIFFGRRVIFAYTRLLRLQTPEEAALAGGTLGHESRVIEAELLGEGAWDNDSKALRFERGAVTYPLPMQPVFIVTAEEADYLFRGAETARNVPPTALVDIGRYVGATDTPCRANIDKMFGSHCAVLGSTGSGKSTAVAAILHGVLDSHADGDPLPKPRIIIIDPHGEYAAAFKDRAAVFRAYNAAGHEAQGSRLLHLPFWLMTSDEFRSLVIGKTEFEATSQANVIYKALTHARMVGAGMIEAATSDWSGKAVSAQTPDAPRPINGFTENEILTFDRDKPCPFDLDEFVRHATYEQALREQKGVWAPLTDSDFNDRFASMLDKLRVLRSDNRISFLMRPEEVTLADVLCQFVGECGDAGDPPVRIIDISGLPNEVAGPLTAAVARLLFQYKQTQTYEERRRDPVILVCEEAHRYVPDRGEAQYAAAQSSVRRIAREGRKYGVGLMLVSQRPSDVESTVISQCSTWVVLRLSNATDQQHVAKFLPDSLSGLAALLPSLPRREALFVGEGAALPARIRLAFLADDRRPSSDDISFAEGWCSAGVSEGEVTAIAGRMASIPVAPAA